MNAVSRIEQHNPIGTDGFEFVEFTAPTPEGIEQLRQLFTAMGFTETARHRSKQVWLFQQHGVNFVLNGSPTGHVHAFAEKHGPSACAMAFRVRNAAQAAAYVKEQGATLVGSHANFGELNIPCVEGIGGSLLYLVDRYGEHSIYDVDFEFIEGRGPDDNAVGLQMIDHLTHNVKRGQMDVWSGFYERIAGFREIRYFDIEGKLTGLVSRAMTAPCGKIRIPINESADDKSQIEEFIREYHGEGIQHIALSTDDIYATVRKLQANGVAFMSTPDTYYDKVDQRVAGHGEPLDVLHDLNLLIDGAPGDDGILLQIFTNTVIGPIFFEIIQRKGNQGFGEGNFKALFESIEEDQLRRGVISEE
ncbi:4-hydroxyphenylpyruvate dioxygenase [Pseudomonas sp. BIGb0408]|uniref:4-hydroxyphenylpyruvate dioxygenase n=1 Tax=Phytopseudomonas flavescens TaxID=29435 RepID=A0A7Z0BMT1_9GAMM|nr:MULTISPECIES: 4-hydroxyphenylpyruvate dioxygenase [Pseudomonas]MCW2293259.1 4-hydroxyphenylpyruvate dioxygenase [Pseudomonas sp. BIGb0408]NYH72170.1 4-hydroxyphenylpyruvate dioxygenase [Pseudomonas flavescens]